MTDNRQEIVPAGAPMGRPSSYSEDIALRICERLAADESLVSICKDEFMPSLTTVYRWKHDNKEFRENYARARNDQGHTVADSLGDVKRKLLDGEIDAATARALSDIIKWEAGRRAPKDFGDKLDVTSSDGSMSPPKTLAEFYGQREKL